MKLIFWKWGITLLTSHDTIAYTGVWEIQFNPLPWIILDGANSKHIAFGWRQGKFKPEIYRSI